MTDDADERPPEGETTAAGARTTAPQSPYETRDVIVGALIALAGALVAFGVPLALA